MINFKKPVAPVTLHAGDELVVSIRRLDNDDDEQLFSCEVESSLAINSVVATDFGPENASFDMTKGVVLVAGFTVKTS